jgi:SAM-dependent methyltransferase
VSFDPAWLDLREPADAAARDRGLLAAAAQHLAGVPAPMSLDLGAGTGATVRAFAGLAPAGTRWRLVDRDPKLLNLAEVRCPGVEVFNADLGNIDALPLAGVRLVTASALLDLMPPSWIEALADRLAASGTAVYAALSYDGAMAWEPPLPDDAAVLAAFNAHQRGDKGLGPALGPDAAAALATALTRRGFAVRTAASPWRLGPAEAALQRELAEGVARAAAEQGTATPERPDLSSSSRSSRS